MVKIDKIDYRGWVNSWRMSNGEVEVVVTGDVGPRVMRYGFAGGQNFFKEFASQMGKTGEATWQPRGDVGPRVMRYGFAGGQNFFKEFASQMGKTGEATWQPRGGHRVWIAPEDV